MKPNTLSRLTVLAALSLLWQMPAYAGPNDFFGASPSSSNDEKSSPSSSSASGSPSESTPAPSKSGAEFTADEKQMQKRYKARVKHAQDLLARAEKMIKDGGNGKNNKMFKRGQVLKGIAERDLENLKSNNPLPDVHKPLENK